MKYLILLLILIGCTMPPTQEEINRAARDIMNFRENCRKLCEYMPKHKQCGIQLEDTCLIVYKNGKIGDYDNQQLAWVIHSIEKYLEHHK